MIWEFDTFRSEFTKVINRSIVEYDMKSANISLAKEFGLLPEKEISRIEAMGKKARVVTVGKIKQKDPTYDKKEKLAFAAARKFFFEMNGISLDDIIAIKRDAIFLTRYVEHERCREHILFRKKNEYTSYIYLKPFEIYYSRSNGLDIKGMNDDIYQTYHADHFGAFLCSVFHRLETSDKDEVLLTIRRFLDNYKWLRLDSEYYREFNALSNYRYKDGTRSVEEYRGYIGELDISHNFKILLDLINIIL